MSGLPTDFLTKQEAKEWVNAEVDAHREAIVGYDHYGRPVISHRIEMTGAEEASVYSGNTVVGLRRKGSHALIRLYGMLRVREDFPFVKAWILHGRNLYVDFSDITKMEVNLP